MATELKQFDPNDIGLKSNNIFGLPFTEAESQLILLPIPWEVTVSYRTGTSRGPEHIFDSSLQVDLYDSDVPNAWKNGYYMLPIDKNIKRKSDFLRHCTELILSFLEEGGEVLKNTQLTQKTAEVNAGGKMLLDWVYEMTISHLKSGKKVGLIGGDHSTPLGFIKALSEIHGSFGILQIDAHADLRVAYEGFTYSHASVMYNVIENFPAVEKLVQVGVRDYSDDELAYIQSKPERIKTYFDQDLKENIYDGGSWKNICENIISQLPQKVYISFDIDGLDPKLCPNTGTPVPGGFELEQIFYLFKLMLKSGKELIGFDLNEVSSGEHNDSIDSIIGARALYKLCNLMFLKS